MTHVLKDQKIWFDGFNLTGVMNALALEYAADALEDTVFGDDTHSNTGGLKTVAASLQGFFDPAKDKIIYDNIGADGKVLSYGAAGTLGSVAYAFKAMLGSYKPGGAVGELFSFSLEAAGEGKLVRGTLMENQSAVAATGDGTIRQLAAVSSGQKLYAILHVLDADGTLPTLDVVVKSDNGVGFATPVTAASFAQAVAVGSQWVEVAGPLTDDYYRVSYTVGGADPSFDFVVILAIM